jgi:hypothetical protein
MRRLLPRSLSVASEPKCESVAGVLGDGFLRRVVPAKAMPERSPTQGRTVALS